MTRAVELRAQARKELLRFETFLSKMSAPAAERRIAWLQDQLASLADNPHRGQSRDRQRFVLVVRYARSAYVIRYRLTRDKVIVSRIWHGREKGTR